MAMLQTINDIQLSPGPYHMKMVLTLSLWALYLF